MLKGRLFLLLHASSVLGAAAIGCTGADNGASEVSNVASDNGSDDDSDSAPDNGTDVVPDTEACAEPTLEQCRDMEWLAEDACGKAAYAAMQEDPEAICTKLLFEDAEKQTADIDTEMAAVPDSLGGGSAVVKVIPNSDHGPSENTLTRSYASLSQQAAIDATEDGLSPDEQAKREKWNQNGNRVEDCEEYVYEKYYDYSLFKDAVIVHPEDCTYVVDVIFGPISDPASIGTRAASGEALKMKDGGAMTVQSPESDLCLPIVGSGCSETGAYKVDNVFYALPTDLLEPYKDQIDDAQEFGLMDSQRCYWLNDCTGTVAEPPTAASAWTRHLDRRDAAIAVGLETVELDAMYPDVRAFEQTAADYHRNRTAPPSCCSVDDLTCCETYEAERTSLEARLGELFEKALAKGCLAAAPTVCDWSPHWLVEHLREAFEKPMEADYQRCIKQVPDPDDFTALLNFQFYFPDGTPWNYYGAADYTTSARDLDHYFDVRNRFYSEDLPAWFQANMPAGLIDPLTGKVRAPGDHWESGLVEMGNGDFGVYYDAEAGWAVPGVEAGGTLTDAELCALRIEAGADFLAGVWVFGSAHTEVLDAGLSASSDGSGTLDARLELLGQNIWGAAEDIRAELDKGEFYIERDVPIFQGRLPFIVPVTITAGFAGKAIATLGTGVTGTQNFDEQTETCELGIDFTLHTGPDIRTEAFVNAAVDVYACEVGVGGSLVLLGWRLPVDLAAGLSVTPSEGIDSLSLTAAAAADFGLHTLDGDVSIYIETDLKWFTLGYSYPIFEWNGLEQSWDLFDADFTVRLKDLAAMLEV